MIARAQLCVVPYVVHICAGIERVSYTLCALCCLPLYMYKVYTQQYMPMSARAEELPTYYLAWWIIQKCSVEKKPSCTTPKPCYKNNNNNKYIACNCDRSESARLYHITSICQAFRSLYSLPIAIFSDSFWLLLLFDSFSIFLSSYSVFISSFIVTRDWKHSSSPSERCKKWRPDRLIMSFHLSNYKSMFF